MFVIDSTDVKRMELVKKELFQLLTHEDLKDIKLLIFANKQDQKGSLSATELTEMLNLHKIKTHEWHIEVSSSLLRFRVVVH